jgi:hypothetical protein
MTTDWCEMEAEGERAYFAHRLASLQIIVCELLSKNESLRSKLRGHAGLGSGAAFTQNQQNGDGGSTSASVEALIRASGANCEDD